METTELSNSTSQSGAIGKTDFLNTLHAGVLNSNAESKKLAAQYSLSLIKASVDHIIPEDKEPDIDATLSVIKEFESENDSKKSVADKYPCSNEMMKELIKDHERIILQIKNKVANYYERYRDGRNISNFLNGIIEEHKAVAWALKRYLVGQ
ncbi:MAG: Dps family ferritin [Bacteroidota bacterium]|jgi:hypothetical protein|nr:Dps family ferritin [Bacteroidota bacterium]